jgi:hypothetical protein
MFPFPSLMPDRLTRSLGGMKSTGPPNSVSLDSFIIDFIEAAENDDSSRGEEEEELERYELLERMQNMIPTEAIELGNLEDEVDNVCTTWLTSDYYYVIPWNGDEFDWALFKISWNDNWGRWDWETCARVGGIANWQDAGRAMLKPLFKSYGYDLTSDENEALRNFIDQIEVVPFL